jgi:hypothetical protein
MCRLIINNLGVSREVKHGNSSSLTSMTLDLIFDSREVSRSVYFTGRAIRFKSSFVRAFRYYPSRKKSRSVGVLWTDFID